MRKIKLVLELFAKFVAAMTLCFLLVSTWVMYNEPFPYIGKPIVQAVTPVTIGEPMTIKISVERIKFCPFRVQREVYDAAGTRVVYIDKVRYPREETSYHLSIDMQEQPVAGPGLFRTRVGSMCNMVQERFPQWQPWNEQQIEFTESR